MAQKDAFSARRLPPIDATLAKQPGDAAERGIHSECIGGKVCGDLRKGDAE